jgi:hypothetical protein
MADKDVIGTGARPRKVLGIAISAAVLAGIGCGLFAAPASAQSLTDRFKSLFGGNSQPADQPSAPPVEGNDLDCPSVSIRPGASTYTVGLPGKQATGSDVRYQATITRTARDCTAGGGNITARVGIEGRVIAGPAGSPATVEIPLRVAVVQGGVQEKTIATKVYRTSVTMNDSGSVPFSLVAEDLVYPVPQGAAGDSYIFYIGFDPQALTPERPAKPARKK